MKKIVLITAISLASLVAFSACKRSADADSAAGAQNAKEAAADNNVISNVPSSGLKLADKGDGVDYVIKDRVFVEGPLEIDPGVTIDVQSEDGILHVTNDGALIIRGTADKPVVIQSSTGSWSGISITSPKQSEISYLTLQNAQSKPEPLGPLGVLRVDGAKIALDHVTVDGSSGYGIDIANGATITRFEHNTIRNCKNIPIQLGSYKHIAMIGEGNVLEGNARQGIGFGYGAFGDNGNVDGDFAFKKLAYPYFIDVAKDIKPTAPVTITIDAGAEFIMGHDKETFASGSIRIGGAAKLVVSGTADAPVVMRGEDAEATVAAMEIGGTAQATIDHVQFVTVGLKIHETASATLSNIAFQKSADRALEIFDKPTVKNGGNITFEDCKVNVYDGRREWGSEEMKELPAE